MTQEKNYMISIVVPFYNIPDEYFIPFIESIKSQTYKNYEVIIVNDGSSNIAINNLRKVISDDGRFIIVDQIHQGVASARNEGLKHVKGNLLWFMDPDDCLNVNNAFDIVVNYFKKDNSIELLSVGYEQQLKSKKTKIVSPPHFYSSGSFYILSLCNDLQSVDGYIWNKIFNLSFYDNGYMDLFDKNLSSFEDKLWLFNVLQKTKVILSVPDVLYLYNYNANSLSRGVNIENVIKRYDDAFNAYEKILKQVTEKYGQLNMLYYSVLVDTYRIAKNNIFQIKYVLKVSKQNEDLISKYSLFLDTVWKESNNKKYLFLVHKILRYIKGHIYGK